MNRLAASTLIVCVCVIAPAIARAESFVVPITLSTSGTFFCVGFAPCFTGAGTNQATITSDTGSATVTFTGVSDTFSVTNVTRQLTLGTFDVTATPGFRFPLNLANPELSIVGFLFRIEGPQETETLLWTFGPGGGTTLPLQFGRFPFGLQPDVDPSPFEGVAFNMNPPLLATNASTGLTADVGLVPEPSTMALIGTGLLGVLARRRKRGAGCAARGAK